MNIIRSLIANRVINTIKCPDCNKTMVITEIGRYECYKCFCTFTIDNNNRVLKYDRVNGEVVKKYVPNKIPLIDRLFYFTGAFILICLSIYGLFFGTIIFPGNHYFTFKFSGYSIITIILCFICLIANYISIIADHFDKRDNQRNYTKFANITSRFALYLFIISIVIQKIQDITNA